MKKVLGFSMAGVYFLAGGFLILKGWYILSPTQNISVGILFVLYSIFRGYRTFSSSEERTKEPNDSLIE